MKDKFQALFRRMWERSDKIFGMLTEEGFYERPIKYRHPFIFYLGHLPAFCWNQLCDGVLHWKSLNPEYDLLFERGIDPPVDRSFHPNESMLWPAIEDVVSYRDRVRASIFDGIEEVDRLRKVTKSDPLIENGRILHVLLEHELMHHETLLYMLCQLDFDKKLKPLDLPPPVLSKNTVNSLVRIDGREIRLGIDFEAVEFGWDNEFGRQSVDVKSFDIDRYPVSNAEFLQFLQDGGYKDSRFWDVDSWQWKSRENIERPIFWIEKEGKLFYHTVFEDLPLEEVMGWPAYVSFAEAVAYARWAGRRIMTEAEFHVAACDEKTYEAGNYDFANWSPIPSSMSSSLSTTGVADLVGNGWEWTSTHFLPFSGFNAYVRTYPGYSKDFFDKLHNVILGASWATDRQIVRRPFRNWFQRHYPYVFAKFRTVSE